MWLHSSKTVVCEHVTLWTGIGYEHALHSQAEGTLAYVLLLCKTDCNQKSWLLLLNRLSSTPPCNLKARAQVLRLCQASLCSPCVDTSALLSAGTLALLHSASTFCDKCMRHPARCLYTRHTQVPAENAPLHLDHK
jgi:hypothetical protein